MATRKLDPAQWKGFFDGVSKRRDIGTVEVEIIGLDVGDQVEAEWQTLTGLSYDPRENRVDVIMETPDGPFDHAISRPQAIMVEEAEGAEPTVEIIDEDDNRHLIRFRMSEPRERPSRRVG